MSGKYAEFVQSEVLPLVESQAHVKLTDDPDGRATMGGSSGGSLRADHGMVSPGMVPPRAHLFGDVCESAVASQSGDAARGVGVFMSI